MKDGPNAWQMSDLAEQFRTGNGVWTRETLDCRFPMPARPIGPNWFSHRWRLAWAVWTGRADALFWEDK